MKNITEDGIIKVVKDEVLNETILLEDDKNRNVSEKKIKGRNNNSLQEDTPSTSGINHESSSGSVIDVNKNFDGVSDGKNSVKSSINQLENSYLCQ